MARHSETLALHAGYEEPDKTTKAVAVPIYQTVAYAFDSADHGAALFDLEAEGYRYTRISNPTTAGPENCVAALEGGIGSLCVSSGQAALHYAILNLVEAGRNIVCTETVWDDPLSLHLLPAAIRGFNAGLPNPTVLRTWCADRHRHARAVFCESVGNPAGNICDVEALADVAHRHGVPLVVDNTVATPMLLRPFEYGAEHPAVSFTDEIPGGHGTTLGGAVVDSGQFPWERYPEQYPMFSQPDASYHGLVYSERFGRCAYIERCRSFLQRITGSVLSPLSAFLLLQGIETLPVTD